MTNFALTLTCYLTQAWGEGDQRLSCCTASRHETPDAATHATLVDTRYLGLGIRYSAMRYNLDGKTFRSLSNTDNGEVGADTVFHYRQSGDIVTADYSGGSIVAGHLIARVMPNGQLDMRYHHLNDQGELMLGRCLSTPERLADGRLRLKEEWQWLSGDMSSGYSEIEEVAQPAG